jgi:hypothetical protein
MRIPAHRCTTALLAAALCAVALSGCERDTAETTATTVPDPPPLDGVTGEVILTRQRDLIDRGLVNVLIDNRSGTSMLLSDLLLDADFFEGREPLRRTFSVRSGRRVAVQVPFGSVDDCDTDRGVDAALVGTLTSDGDRPVQDVRIRLGGTDILDTIRRQQCTTAAFDSATTVVFERTSVNDGVVDTDLVIEPNGADADLAVHGVSGTVLVGVRGVDDGDRIELDDAAVRIPLTFVVNRCDPHALAEVTKRFGLDVAVSVGGADPVDVAVDIGDLVPDLETIVEECVADAAGE